jgi:squalene-hopene/tetraprenyl-beta-curcumene cyclase
VARGALALPARPAGAPSIAATATGAETWLRERIGQLTPDRIAAAVLARYGQDRTFSAPILTLCALAGRLGVGCDAWAHVPPLPFELAALPRRAFRWLGLPVVSYALPALIAIGLVRHELSPEAGMLRWALRRAVRRRVLGALHDMQPASGGYLEAVPLTSFVAMSLAACGHRAHPVVGNACVFLDATVRGDGSWPIDTNLSTWVTTLAVNALVGGKARVARGLTREQCDAIRGWLLNRQWRTPHPFSGAAPGGWAWTDRPGGVPDADDTAGALLALRALGQPADAAVLLGLGWLLDLQNRDGGIPTFCRGWGKLPFDRSAPEVTAHGVRAFIAWRGDVPEPWRERLDNGVRRAVAYLARTQRPDGAWTPLWFGNAAAPEQTNPTWGTVQVVKALKDLAGAEFEAGCGDMLGRARQWLRTAQGADGGWGGAPGVAASIEETAAAVEALAGGEQDAAAVGHGVEWLLRRTNGCRAMDPAPIGLYFASLWYSEALYPWVFSVAALRARCGMDVARNPVATGPGRQARVPPAERRLDGATP